MGVSFWIEYRFLSSGALKAEFSCNTKLGRDVAVKVLSEALCQDKASLARFGREAHLLASLNHPNIAAIYGLEEFGPQKVLVLELVEGETLAERLRHGPLPVKEALEFVKQIAEALESAHDNGVVHRDLKPGNVKVSPSGTVKVLDFGLAKAVNPDAAAVDAAVGADDSTAVTRWATVPGVILGTAAYMSPEQAQGMAVTKQTDIWALGCVLYECLSGKRAFGGGTTTEAIRAVLQKEPDWEALPTTTPAIARKLLRRCLEKETSNRLHDVADVRIELAEALGELQSGEAESQRLKPQIRLAFACAMACLLIAAITGTWFVAKWSTRKEPGSDLEAEPVTRSYLDLPASAPLALDCNPGGWDHRLLALSPDGNKLVYGNEGPISSSDPWKAQRSVKR